jgi:hypothetical protein
VLFHCGIRVPLTESIEKLHWNFSSVDWESFAADFEYVVRFITACIRAAAKRHVSRGFRKVYIPGWNQDCENLYQQYNTNHERATANRLLEELNDQRKRKWEKRCRTPISSILAEKRGVYFGNLVPIRKHQVLLPLHIK